jgi:hypothetical protein
MSRMSKRDILEYVNQAERLVIDAISEEGIMSERDILEYVNDRLPIEVDARFIESVLDKYLGDDWYGGDIRSYN